MTFNHTIKLAVLILFNLVFFGFVGRWLYHNVDFARLLQHIHGLNGWSLAAAMVIGAVLYFCYGQRLATLLDRPMLTGTQIVVMGFGFNALLPFRIGDVIKIICTKSFFQIDLTRTTFVSVVEKSLDLMIILSLGAVFIFHHVPGLLYFAFPGLMAALLLFKYRDRLIACHPLCAKLLHMVNEVLARHKLAKLSGLTVLIWSMTWLMFYVFFKSNIGPAFGGISAVSLMVMTTLSLSVPSAPASVGLFEAGIVFYLKQQLHVATDQALALAVVFHLSIIVPQILTTLLILLVNARRSIVREPVLS